MTESLQRLPLGGSSRGAWIWLVLLAIVLPATIFAVALIAARATPPWPVAAIAIVAIAIAFLWIVRMMRRIAVTIERDALIVDAGIARRRFALSSLAAGGLRTIDLDTHAELKPVLRTWGIGLPGLSSGWFLLRNREKAFCILTGRRRVTALRAADGTRILLSLADPAPLERALDAHRARG